MKILQKEILYYGKTGSLPKQINLRSGNVDIQYESGNLRHIRCGENEILRMIYPAVRDRNWKTLNCEIRNEEILIEPDRFTITYEAEYCNPSPVYFAKYLVKGDKEGTILFEMSGEMLTDFLKNRIGFCILHPIKECAGEKVIITHPDNSSETFEFPVEISPHQPFDNISEMKWNINNTENIIKFKSDIFETEDQRNWSDASYKTYCTPLEKPFPVLLNKGHKIFQSVEVKIKTENSFKISKKENSIEINSKRVNQFPPIGFFLTDVSKSFTLREKKLIQQSGCCHLRYDINFNDPGWREKFISASRSSNFLDIPFECTLNFKEETLNDFDEFYISALQEKAKLKYINIFKIGDKATPGKLLNILTPRLRKNFPTVKIGAGTNYDFTDLNRNPISSIDIDYLFYSVCPQVHAFDNLTLIENLAAQTDTVSSAKKLSKIKNIHISAVSLKRRSNPDATGEEKTPEKFVLPKDVDPRQMSLFGAAWTLGTIKYLSQSGVDLITLFEPVGLKGIMMYEVENKFINLFHAEPGMVYPMWFILNAIKQFKPCNVIQTVSSSPLEFDVLLLSREESRLLIAANYTSITKTIKLNNSEFGKAFIRTIDETNIEPLMKDPELFSLIKHTAEHVDEIVLKPFGIAFIMNEPVLTFFTK